jgi:hypothetical protein
MSQLRDPGLPGAGAAEQPPSVDGSEAGADMLLIAFASLPPQSVLESLPPDATLLTQDPPPAGQAWQSISDYIAPARMDDALALLEELNTLRDDDGVPYASLVTHHGFETWWCHQQDVLDLFILPFIRYRSLLAKCAGVARVIVHGCPPDLRRILPLVAGGGRVELVDPRGPRGRAALLRRMASGLLYRVVSALALGRAALRAPEYLVYTFDATDDAGRNPWISGLYDALARRTARFVELVWSDSGARALRQLRARRRSVLYCQAIAPRGRAGVPVGTNPFESDSDRAQDVFLKAVADTVLLPRARQSVRTVRRFERLLRRLRPRGVFIMDDPLHVWELVIACKRRRVPTVALQHGQFSRATAGLMGYGYHGAADLSFDRYCVWNAFFRDLLLRHGRLIPASAIVVAGRPRAGAPARAVGGGTPVAPPEAGGAGRVILLSERHDAATRENEVDPYVHALLAAGIDLRVKPHPGMPQDQATHVARVASGTLEEVLESADVVVASFSSAIFDAILHEVPVVLFATSLFADPHGLADAGLADLALRPDELVDRVRSAATLSPHELARRRERVWGGARDGDGGEVAVREMEGLRARS